MADRRDFLKLATAGAFAAHPAIARALSVAPRGPTGTIADVEHVVILMQENRSFDHYFGAMRGVRGFDDPRPISLPGARSVWLQPRPDGKGDVAPFRLDTRNTSAEHMASLDHSWKKSHALWKNHDAWIAVKGEMTMGHFTRDDLPFYYALADAFTVCDAYHCSIFTSTNPNRCFLFTGTSGLSAGYDGQWVVRNPDELNETADPHNDTSIFEGLSWTTYAERLEGAGVSWKVYQEFDNYGDNALAFFKQFRGADARPSLMARGRGCVEGSTAANAKTSNGEHLISALARDVKAGTLPQVSWIVAPYIACEHPSACPSTGERLTAGVLDALTADPETWAKTVFILNFDENDGFFDHVPPPLPAVGAALGKSTVSVDDETYHGEPVGLGPRVPMIIASPWTRGGYVDSEVFDHTSVIRFLEARFGVREPNISPWRRSVCGDLTSAFDFSNRALPPPLPDASDYLVRAAASKTLASPRPPLDPKLPRQEPGQRPARALPYALAVTGRIDAEAGGLRMAFINEGRAGACFDVRTNVGSDGPWFYTVESGKRLEDVLPVEVLYDLSVRGPNGFLRDLRGRMESPAADLIVDLKHDGKGERVLIVLRNTGSTALTATVRPAAYDSAPGERRELAPGAAVEVGFKVTSSAGWYDLVVATPQDQTFVRRFAGHVETGRASLSDPLIGSGAA
jgi:phospholipase C